MFDLLLVESEAGPADLEDLLHVSSKGLVTLQSGAFFGFLLFKNTF